MILIDADTHLREGIYLDEVYKLQGEFAEYAPRKTKGGAYHEVQFENEPMPWGEEVEKHGRHRQLYGPDRQGGRIAAIQPGGWDRDQRVNDLAKAGIEKQVMFCTGSAVPTLTACLPVYQGIYREFYASQSHLSAGKNARCSYKIGFSAKQHQLNNRKEQGILKRISAN